MPWPDIHVALSLEVVLFSSLTVGKSQKAKQRLQQQECSFSSVAVELSAWAAGQVRDGFRVEPESRIWHDRAPDRKQEAATLKDSW